MRDEIVPHEMAQKSLFYAAQDIAANRLAFARDTFALLQLKSDLSLLQGIVADIETIKSSQEAA